MTQTAVERGWNWLKELGWYDHEDAAGNLPDPQASPQQAAGDRATTSPASPHRRLLEGGILAVILVSQLTWMLFLAYLVQRVL